MNLPREYEIAIKYPYDGLDTHECSKERLIALAILSDLLDRKGIKNAFYDIDRDIKAEIIESMASLIKVGIEKL